MKKADYGQIAHTYDVVRPISEQNLELWVSLISKRIGPLRKVDFLDLGCGTGRFSIPIAKRLGYSVTGADISREMLEKARGKDGAAQVRWDVQDATSLSYPNGSFDAVFMSHLLHHVDEPSRVVKECYRVLRPRGTILNRYAPIEHIRDDPEHRFFSGAIEIDEARTPIMQQVEEWFRIAGFIDISSETIVQRSYSSAHERLEVARLKHTSVLTLISQRAYELGIEAFQRYVSENPDDTWILLDRMTLTTGKKELRWTRSETLPVPCDKV